MKSILDPYRENLVKNILEDFEEADYSQLACDMVAERINRNQEDNYFIVNDGSLDFNEVIRQCGGLDFKEFKSFNNYKQNFKRLKEEMRRGSNIFAPVDIAWCIDDECEDLLITYYTCFIPPYLQKYTYNNLFPENEYKAFNNYVWRAGCSFYYHF